MYQHLIGDIMNFILKGFIIGIGKIIPRISGLSIAIILHKRWNKNKINILNKNRYRYNTFINFNE